MSRRTSIGLAHEESAKRKFEEELAAEEEFGYEGLLEGRTAKRQRNDDGFSAPMPTSARGSFSNSSGMTQVERRRVHEPPEADAEMEFDLTVRGKLHWVGVMKDWNWESKSSIHFFYWYRRNLEHHTSMPNLSLSNKQNEMQSANTSQFSSVKI
jgi:hypothetical protein